VVACDGGEAAACRHAGIVYTKGLGVPRDEDRGRRLSLKACKLGDPRACK